MQLSKAISFIFFATLMRECFAEPYEHVILADCLSASFIQISQMAYYAWTLEANPDTVTAVPSPWNQTVNWVRDATDPVFATFPDGINFTASLSTNARPGDQAGTGTNGWGVMNCWSYPRDNMYSWYNGVRCNAVYDCNRRVGAGDSPSAPKPTDSSDSANTCSKESDDIALGVGIGLGLPTLFVGVASAWLTWRRGKEGWKELLRLMHHPGSGSHVDAAGQAEIGLGGEVKVDDAKKLRDDCSKELV